MHQDLDGYVTPFDVSSEHQLSNLLDSIPSLVARIDCNMIMQFANKPFKKLFIAPETIPGNAFYSIVGNHVFSQVQLHMGKVLVGGCAHFQISVPARKGFYYLDINLSPEFDELQKVKGFIFHGIDVTEKFSAERELKDYFENTSIGLHRVNADGMIIWANQAELTMLGYTAEEYIGHHISEFHNDNNVITDMLTRLGRNEVLSNYEAVLLCKNGSKRHVAINSSVLWEGDRFIHTRCFTIDLTEQRLAEQTVRESEERFRMMANLVPLVIWTTDDNGGCNYLSVRWKELTGKNVEEGFGNYWLTMVHPDDREKIQISWATSLSAKRSFEAKFRYINSQGGYTTTYANASPRYNVSGAFIGYIGILQDISAQEQIKLSLEKIVMERTDDLRQKNAALRSAENSLKEKNQELQIMNQELSSFAYIASHDLQEPLRKIQIFSQRLLELENLKLSERGKDYFNRIQIASDRMRKLIDDLLTYSRAGNTDGDFQSTDLNLILKDVMNELEVKIEEKNAIVKSTRLPKVKAVKFQFHQLFLNLLSNALKFSKPDTAPCIFIKAEVISGSKIPGVLADVKKNYYHISVSDNGIGFLPEFNTRIFEIFQRLHGSSEYEGTGIGLSICKKIVENHKGIMMADGKPDEGATFHLYLEV